MNCFIIGVVSYLVLIPYRNLSLTGNKNPLIPISAYGPESLYSLTKIHTGDTAINLGLQSYLCHLL